MEGNGETEKVLDRCDEQRSQALGFLCLSLPLAQPVCRSPQHWNNTDQGGGNDPTLSHRLQLGGGE